MMFKLIDFVNVYSVIKYYLFIMLNKQMAKSPWINTNIRFNKQYYL